MKYIFVHFLPGAAGNFFSRCLNLLENSYCFADARTNKIPTNLDDKIQMLSYSKIKDKPFDQRNWVQFESALKHYQTCQDHWNLPADSTGIWFSHTQTNLYGLAGKDDTVYKFYIDSSEVFEWTIMNALYKNSYIDVKWLIESKKLKTDNQIQKINLKKIITSQTGFLEEFCQVCKIIGHNISDSELGAVKNLYNEWIQTTLTFDKIPQFKQHIGFLL